MKEFLNKAMKEHQKGETKKVETFLRLFPKVTEFIATTLGGKPFNLRGPLNTSALDSVMCVAFESLAKLEPEDFMDRFKKLSKDKDFERLTQIGTTDTKTLQDRVALCRNYLIEK